MAIHCDDRTDAAELTDVDLGYEAPELVEIGDAGDLTQDGNFGGSDGMTTLGLYVSA